MATKKLALFIHLDGEFVPAGLLNLTETSDGVDASNFSYGQRYLERKNLVEIDPVSLTTTDIESIKGKRLFPAEGLNLFGGIRDAAPDGWGRRVIESRLKVPPNSLPESTYLLEAGSARIGALDIRNSIESPTRSHRKHSIHRLEYLMEAADRIEQGLPVPTHLEEIFEVGSNMGGMRPKVTIEKVDGSQWLAKFRAPKDRMNVPMIEYATMRLAKEAKLDVPRLGLETVGDKEVMLIERFDRALINGADRRNHMVSALTMLGCHESESKDKSYWNIADSIRKRSPSSLIHISQKELFGRMVFNILVTNDDDHLRNHAFLWSAENKAWQLSPLYDVMPRPMVASERNLHLGVGNQGRYANLDNALSGYARFGLSLRDAKEVIDRIWRVTREWKTYFEEWGVSIDEIGKISTAFRHIDDVIHSKNVIGISDKDDDG